MRLYSPHLDIEHQLISKAKGEQCNISFGRLYSIYHPKIVKHCIGIVGNREDGEDAASLCFIKVYTNLNRLKQDKLFSSWVYRIATYVCYDMIRKKKRRKESPIPFDEEWIVLPEEQEKAEQLNPTKFIHLQNLIRKLSPSNQEIFTLRYEYNLSIKEMVDLLPYTESAIKMRLLRIRKNLRGIATKKQSA